MTPVSGRRWLLMNWTCLQETFLMTLSPSSCQRFPRWQAALCLKLNLSCNETPLAHRQEQSHRFCWELVGRAEWAEKGWNKWIRNKLRKHELANRVRTWPCHRSPHYFSNALILKFCLEEPVSQSAPGLLRSQAGRMRPGCTHHAHLHLPTCQDNSTLICVV